MTEFPLNRLLLSAKRLGVLVLIGGALLIFSSFTSMEDLSVEYTSGVGGDFSELVVAFELALESGASAEPASASGGNFVNGFEEVGAGGGAEIFLGRI